MHISTKSPTFITTFEHFLLRRRKDARRQPQSRALLGVVLDRRRGVQRPGPPAAFSIQVHAVGQGVPAPRRQDDARRGRGLPHGPRGAPSFPNHHQHPAVPQDLFQLHPRRGALLPGLGQRRLLRRGDGARDVQGPRLDGRAHEVQAPAVRRAAVQCRDRPAVEDRVRRAEPAPRPRGVVRHPVPLVVGEAAGLGPALHCLQPGRLATQVPQRHRGVRRAAQPPGLDHVVLLANVRGRQLFEPLCFFAQRISCAQPAADAAPHAGRGDHPRLRGCAAARRRRLRAVGRSRRPRVGRVQPAERHLLRQDRQG